MARIAACTEARSSVFVPYAFDRRIRTAISTDAGVNNLAQRLIREQQMRPPHLLLVRQLWGGAGAPGDHPMCLCSRCESGRHNEK